MRSGISPTKVGHREEFDIETTDFVSPTNETLYGFAIPNVSGPVQVNSISRPQFPTVQKKSIRIEGLACSMGGPSQIHPGSRWFRPVHFMPSASTSLQLLFATVFCIYLPWTIWLIFLNISPNYTVNLVMNTEDFDSGVFWFFVDPPPLLRWFSVAGFSIVGVGYVFILVMIEFRPKRVVHQATPSAAITTKRTIEPSDRVSTADKIAKRVTSSAKLVVTLATTDSMARRLTKIGMKIIDLAFETVLLIQTLEAGSPIPIVVIFTLVIVSNALVCTVTMFISYKRIGLVEAVNDLVYDIYFHGIPITIFTESILAVVCLRFDLLIVVGCPMLVLMYCLSTFNFPREQYAINQEVFIPQAFEHLASLIADPAQTAVIYKSLNSLRITSVLDLLARMAVHATLFLRLGHLVNLIQNPQRQHIPVYPRRHRPAAVAFTLFAIGLIVFVEESVRTSAIACDPHPECVVHARRWTFLDSGSLTQCPCLMMIDRDVAPKTFAEWEQPRNVTEIVAQLATTGDLQTLKLTNRFLPVLPDELRRCTNMRHLTLEYTHTQTLPAWIKTFSQLEFLHLESKFTSPFVALPDDMFEHMSSLTFLHFGALTSMKRLPSFKGLTNLKSLTLAVLLMLEELPDFDSLHHLESLVVICVPSLHRLPDFAPIRRLKSLALLDRGAWCCNGFLGECNLDDPMCQVHPLWGTPAATCVSPDQSKATPETLLLIKKYSQSVCKGLALPSTFEAPPTAATMAPCKGTLYRQCIDPSGMESMCYNVRFMGITCDSNPFPIKMRRRQIEKGVGDPCDPEYEAWLGCK